MAVGFLKLAFVATLVAGSARAVSAATVEDQLDQINRLPEKTRSERLEKGAPADFVFSEPFVPVKTPTTVSISSGAPHFQAAALFVDFLLSKAGQDIMVAQGRWASRKDADYFADLKGKKMQIPSPDWDDKQVELIKLYNNLFSLR